MSVKDFTIYCLGLICLLVLSVASPPAIAADDASTGFEGLLTMPHGANPVGRPGALYYDAENAELYVTDIGLNRILLFDSNDNFVFEFSDPAHLKSPKDLAVDSTGRIWCVDGAENGTAVVFDFDGRYLQTMQFRDKAGSLIGQIAGFLMTSSNRLLVLTTRPAMLRRYSLEGDLLDESQFLTGLSEETQQQDYFGRGAIVDHMLVLPMPMIQAVGRFTLDGKLINFFGESGGVPGTMSFPVAAAGDGSGNMIVLDKHRHVLIKYNEDCRYVTEFGGIGNEPGKCYHPTVVTSNLDGECFVGQTFEQRIQRFRTSAPVKTNDLGLKQ